MIGPGARQLPGVDYVVKLHGSSNFSTPADRNVMAQLSTGNTHVETRIDSFDPFATLTENSATRILPVMTQISPGRDDFLAPAQIYQIRQMWERAIRHASLIVVIGVAPRTYDTHIWNPLRDATGEMVHIGGTTDGLAWRTCNPRIRSLGATFRQGFRPLLRRLAVHKRRAGGGMGQFILDTGRAYCS